LVLTDGPPPSPELEDAEDVADEDPEDELLADEDELLERLEFPPDPDGSMGAEPSAQAATSARTDKRVKTRAEHIECLANS
jgi:hypothetical protein